MKKLFFYISLIACTWACEKDQIDEITPTEIGGKNGKTTVVFQTEIPGLTDYATTLEPMSRAGLDTIKTIINPRYRAIIIKWTNQKWVIDTILFSSFNSNSWSPYIIRNNTTLPPISVELRPGKYKIGLFLNADYNLTFLNTLKIGQVVSNNETIGKDDILAPAYKLSVSSDNAQTIKDEVFSGSIEFTVGKNDHLENSGPTRPTRINVTRKVSRFRYLLKEHLPEDSISDIDFFSTQYDVLAHLETTSETPFCDGLDILGRPHYHIDSTYTRLIMYMSDGANRFESEKDHRIYHMTFGTNPPVITGSFPTYAFPFILTDDTKPEGIPITLTSLRITGQANGYSPVYKLPDDFTQSFVLKPNSILQTIYEVVGRDSTYKNEKDEVGYYLRLVNDPDAKDLFHAYFELNPTASKYNY